MSISPVDLQKLLHGMSGLLTQSVGPAVRVDVRIDDDARFAVSDANQLELAILNLAVNGRDAMGGGGRLDISLDQAELPNGGDGLDPGRYIRLAVKDSGVGMDELTMARAIEPFFTTKGQGEGTGLGLSMVHGLAAQSGGALKIRSKLGKGTTAELWLPAADGQVEALRDRDNSLPTQPRRATILLVDDEDLVRQATAEMLKEMGHRVVEAGSGTAALGQLNSGPEFDLLITDYLMPGLRGSELAEEARRRSPGLPALLLTGYANLAKGEAAGMPRLSKPFREADLAREVAALLAVESTVGERPTRLHSV
jgi:CheY-like chemotaxis protein/two-component sensor histidine kinase